MPILNPVTWISKKIDNTLNKNINQPASTTQVNLDAHTQEALDILRASPGTPDADIATVLNLSSDVAEPFIKHAKRILLKEQLTRPLPVAATSTDVTAPPQEETTIVTGRWMDAGEPQLEVPRIIVRMEEHRRTARDFSEDREGWTDRLVRNAAKTLLYLGPVVLAFFVAMIIAEQYVKLNPNDFWWSPAMYAIALVTEGSLWGTSFAASREFKKMLSDRKRIPSFLVLVFGFTFFSAISILAQWFVYESKFVSPDLPTVVGIVFRTCSTTAVDTMALISLAVLDHHSFEAHLKRQKLEAQHIQELSQTEIDTERKIQEEIVRKQNADIENQRQIKRNLFFAEQESEHLKRLAGGQREERSRW